MIGDRRMKSRLAMTNDKIDREELKERILLTATKLFYENGIRKIKMDMIASALHISKRTLYEVYDKKEDLLFEVLKREEETYICHLEKFNKSGVSVIDIITEIIRFKIEQFNNITPNFFKDLNKYPHLLDYLDKKHKEHSSERNLFIQRGVEEGYFLDNMNIEIANLVAETAFRQMTTNPLYAQFELKEVFKTLILLHVRGFCTLKGIEILDRRIKEL